MRLTLASQRSRTNAPLTPRRRRAIRRAVYSLPRDRRANGGDSGAAGR